MNFWNKVKNGLKRTKVRPEKDYKTAKNGSNSKRETKSKVVNNPELVHIPKGYEMRYTPEFIKKSKEKRKAKRRAQKESRRKNRK